MACATSILWFMPFVYINEQMHQSGEHIGSFAYLILVFPYIASILLFFRQNFVSSIFSLVPLFMAAFLMIMFHENYGYGLAGISIAMAIQIIIPAIIYHTKAERSYIESLLFMLPVSLAMAIITIMLRSQNLISTKEMAYIVAAYIIGLNLLIFIAMLIFGFLAGINNYRVQEKTQD